MYVVILHTPEQGGFIDLKELKANITSSNWIKIGSKYNSPALSIFSEETKKDLLSEEYHINKIYYFEDDTHDYKIQCLPDKNKQLFVIFAKSKTPIAPVIVKEKKAKQKFNISFKNKMDTNQIIIIIAVAVVLIASVLLSGPIIRVFGG